MSCQTSYGEEEIAECYSRGAGVVGVGHAALQSSMHVDVVYCAMYKYMVMWNARMLCRRLLYVMYHGGA